jgi:hypothetical protein
MALIDITPKMTSNTTPSPYVISASSIYSTTFEAWRAFNGTLTDANDSWVTILNSIAGWIMIDLSVITKIDAISIHARNEAASLTASPKDLVIYGSNDGITFTEIRQALNQVVWSAAEGRLFKFAGSVSFRYYKISIASNNGGTYSQIGDIKLWQDNGVTTQVTNIEASMDICLPRNTTLAIKQKQNDYREGLLGFANDDTNYGTMYMVDNKGRSMIPMAGVKQETIFQGSISKTGTGTISKPYTDFKLLLVKSKSSNAEWSTYTLIPVDKITGLKADGGGAIIISMMWTSSTFANLRMGFQTTTIFTVGDSSSGNWGAPVVTEIIGIY